MTRSVALLDSLSQEKERWGEGSEGFKQQMSTILSDCLVSAAFLAYAGYYDQHMRENMFTSWLSHLHQAKLKYRDDIARIEVDGAVEIHSFLFQLRPRIKLNNKLSYS